MVGLLPRRGGLVASAVEVADAVWAGGRVEGWGGSVDRAFEGAVEEYQQGVADGEAVAGVEAEDGDALLDRQGPADLVEAVGQGTVEGVDADDERQLGPFEEVDGGVAV